MVGQPGALPLLQFTLAELFDRRDGGRADRRRYRELGGVAGALARGAEDLYGALGDDGRSAARQLFLRLVDAGRGRARTPAAACVARELLSVAATPTAMEPVIDRFERRRLLTFDRDPDTREPTVEVAHEALLSAWHRLRDWLDEAATTCACSASSRRPPASGRARPRPVLPPARSAARAARGVAGGLGPGARPGRA